jgi:hypothetical protein
MGLHGMLCFLFFQVARITLGSTESLFVLRELLSALCAGEERASTGVGVNIARSGGKKRERAKAIKRKR